MANPRIRNATATTAGLLVAAATPPPMAAPIPESTIVMRRPKPNSTRPAKRRPMQSDAENAANATAAFDADAPSSSWR